MLSIRENVFESNSSSVHSITVTSKKVTDDWENGKLIFVADWGKFFALDELWGVANRCKAREEESDQKWIKEHPNETNEYEHNRLKESAVIWNGLTKEIFVSIVADILKSDGYIDRNTDYDNPDSDWMFNLGDLTDRQKVVSVIINSFGDGIYANFDAYSESLEYYETFWEDQNVDGVDVVAFGYYGHD